jgi:hypothetical protein
MRTVDDSAGYTKLVVGDMMMMSSYLYVDELVLPYVD